MIQLIAFIIFVISASTTAFILYRKMPALANLPQNGHHGLKKPAVVANLEKKIKEHHTYLFKKKMLLHKILSKARIWIMRIEHYIDTMLHGIRKNAQELDKKVRRKRGG